VIAALSMNSFTSAVDQAITGGVVGFADVLVFAGCVASGCGWAGSFPV